MKQLTTNLKRKLMEIKRHEHHPLLHKIYKTHKISHKTLFYMKEYGRKSNVTYTIIKESLLALIIAFIIGTVSGISLQNIKANFLLFAPLIILLPSLNSMSGNYSMIMVSRLSTLIFSKGPKRNFLVSEDIREIIRTIISVAILSAIYIGILSSIIAYFKGFMLNLGSVLKVIEVSLLTTLFMTSIVTILSAFSVFYVYSKKEDPNNIVMPLMTPIADLGTILVFALTVNLIF